MVKSATGLRERRRLETAKLLSGIARRRTAETGLSGYTVEELCDEAGVSRRTFFNYFASKEDAVLGIPLVVDASDLEEAFIAGGTPGDGLSPTLVDDFIDLIVGRWELISLTASDAASLFAAVEREPKLHGRFLDHMREREREDVELIERREGLASGDIRASTLVHLGGTFNRLAVEEYLRSHGDDPPAVEVLLRIVRERLAAARELLG